MSESKGVKLGATKGKLALVAILAATLLGVVASNFGGSGEAAPDPAIAAQAPEPAPATPPASSETEGAVNANAAEKPTGPFAEFADDVNWPHFTFEEVSQVDPLAVPLWAGPPPPSDVGTGREFSEDQLAELQSAENAIIFVSGDKRVALIGAHEYQVGDVIGGLQIRDISSSGIVLSDPE